MVFRLATATIDDVPTVLSLISALAEYEQLADHLRATEPDLRAALFGPKPAAEVIIGYAGSEPAGFALYFQSFSTFVGRPGLYLEDLFVKPEWRRQGLGRQAAGAPCAHRGRAPGRPLSRHLRPGRRQHLRRARVRGERVRFVGRRPGGLPLRKRRHGERRDRGRALPSRRARHRDRRRHGEAHRRRRVYLRRAGTPDLLARCARARCEAPGSLTDRSALCVNSF